MDMPAIWPDAQGSVPCPHGNTPLLSVTPIHWLGTQEQRVCLSKSFPKTISVDGHALPESSWFISPSLSHGGRGLWQKAPWQLPGDGVFSAGTQTTQTAGSASCALLPHSRFPPTAHTPPSQAAICGCRLLVCCAGQPASMEGIRRHVGSVHSEARSWCWCSAVYTCQTRNHSQVGSPQ